MTVDRGDGRAADESRSSGEIFLDAYARCERYLRRVTDADRGVPFGHLVREASRRDRIVRRFRDDLLEFAELRNAIVHQRVDGRPIAEPHPKIAAQFEHIADLLDAPPRLADRFARHVAVTTAATPLVESLDLMRRGDYSTLPVYDHDRFVGVLTASAIARWLTSVSPRRSVDLSIATRDVLVHGKHADERVKFVSRRASLIDTLELFQEGVDHGVKLDALIMTETGQRDETPLGIVTPADLPEILDQLDGANRPAPRVSR